MRLPWWLRACSCHVDVMFGRFHSVHCKRHGDREVKLCTSPICHDIHKPEELTRCTDDCPEWDHYHMCIDPNCKKCGRR
jgi:hypothetical protein